MLITALQSIVSRNVGPFDEVVLSVTSIESSSKTFNVIPQTVHLKGTIRTHYPKVQATAKERLFAIATGTVETLGGKAVVKYDEVYPILVNHEEQTEFATEMGRLVSGKCEEASRVMGGEDFAFMLEERPGAFILVGNGDSAWVDNPKFDFDDDLIPIGCSWWIEVVENRIPIG